MSRHQKRITVPRSWPIQRKTNKWVAKANPGPHSSQESLPLLVVIRDLLKLVDNAREAKRILHEGAVLVDGKARRDYKFPVGLFDVVSIPLLGQQYRMLHDRKGRFHLSLLEAGEARKLARIDNKTVLKGGKIQLNLNDGHNILTEGEFKTGDSLVLKIPEKEIIERIEFKEGNLAMIVGGTHAGQIGRVKEIHVVKSSRPNKVIISGEEEFETIEDYVFMIGTEKSAIKLGEMGVAK
jgi:small subunit ribosomal protein S4e